jgi:hypothetical protein
MKTLDEIGIHYGTDKASVFTRTYAKPHGYLRHMEKFFEPMREKPIKLVEIGVGGGESICTWLEYFSWSFVIGIDRVHSTNKWNTPKKFGNPPGGIPLSVEDRYAFMAADQNDPTFWACFAADVRETVDIAIDDGSHEPAGIITAFNGLWPLIKPGGLYCIEDLACGFTSAGFPIHLDWLRALMEAVNHGIGDIDSIHFSKELAILRKKG